MAAIRRGLIAVWKPPGLLSSKLVNEIKFTLQGGQGQLDLHPEEVERYGKDYSSVKQRYQLKVGHGGTLDSFAEGVMVIGLGESCKRLPKYLKHTDKDYTVVCRLGEMTDTLTPEGKVIEQAPWDHVKREDLEGSMGEFRGTINQVAPVFSARRFKGRRYSDLAVKARGTGSPPPQPKPKSVTIHSLQLLSFEPPNFTISVSCSSGTYMRSLSRDIAVTVGSVGYATAVIRTRQGEFSKENSLMEENWTIEKMRDYIRQNRTYSL